MYVIFRADSSHLIGSGHVMRCLTLAAALRDRGISVAFVSRESAGHLCDVIAERGIPLMRMPASEPRGSAVSAMSAETLDATWESDAEETRAAIAATGSRPDWLIVDHYGLDHRWESAMRSSANRIMAIDDMALRSHDCDLLLDQNLDARPQERYTGKVPSACRMLLGPEFSLLQPAYASLHDRVPPREGPVKRLLISFGGADRGNLTGRTLSAIERLNRPDVAIDVVFSPNGKHAEAVRSQIARFPNVTGHGYLPSLASLMARADVAIGGAGSTSWERLCLGIPSIVVTIAENQRPIAEALAARELARYLGHHDVVTVDSLALALRELLAVPVDEAWSLRCRAIVDGRGASRVASILTAGDDAALSVRPARLSDAEGPAGASVLADLRRPDVVRRFVVQDCWGERIGQARFELLEGGWHGEATVEANYDSRVSARRLREITLGGLREDLGGAVVLSPRSARQGWRVTIGTAAASWINASIPAMALDLADAGHQVTWAHDPADLPGGDICLLLGYDRVVGKSVLGRYRASVVVHESALPAGRGWSPLTWQVLEGKRRIPIMLIEAGASVDSGRIFLEDTIDLRGDELVAELRHAQAAATTRLCIAFVDQYPGILGRGRDQVGEPTYYRRRGLADGEIQLDVPLRDQLNLLRVSDNVRYPTWINLNGRRVKLLVEE